MNETQDHNKEFTIFVNSREKTVTSKELTFTQIVALSFESPLTGENIIFTVTYRKGDGNKQEGTLTEGDTVNIKDGMIFNVTTTNKS